MNASIADLRRLDELNAYEYPSDFDYDEKDRRARELHSLLEYELNRKLGFEDGAHNQDASFSWAIILSSYQEGNTTFIQNCLRISNFGNLVAVTNSDYEGTNECLTVFRLCSAIGFTPVFSDILETKYDGVNSCSLGSWWIRYFDWI